jgi:hypothetical protein
MDRHRAVLLKGILVEHRPSDHVPQVSVGAMTEIGVQTFVASKSQKGRLHNVA